MNDNAGLERLITSLIASLGSRVPAPTMQDIEDVAATLAPICGYSGKISHAVEQTLHVIDSRMGLGISLIDKEATHDTDWPRGRDDIIWTYSENYARYLKLGGWSEIIVSSLGDVTQNILGLLQDPMDDGSWDRRGLVIGHVQSGKTANYAGLITKAADAGYKFIVVIAGIHNNLRRQTQERIDEGFVGRSSDPDNRSSIGVGNLGREHPTPVSLTTIYEDFQKKTATVLQGGLNDFSKPVVIVIKKNVSTLARLQEWLRDFNTSGQGGRIEDVPMLMIDDEADNASINTSKPNLDPTKTNRLLREILQLFKKSCYVGYTATPFANIFIDPDSYADALEDLFPKDFIYCLDAPTSYFGAEKVFLDEDTSEQATRAINDAEDYLPLKHKKEHDIIALPPSLLEAVNVFCIARAIRVLRGQSHKHCSMLVNVSRFVAVQNTVKTMLSIHIKSMKEAVRANYAMPGDAPLRNPYMAALKKAFEKEYSVGEETWNQVRAELFDAVDSVRMYVVNSKSDEALDYKKYDNGLTAIAVGGLSLSRGVTLEGLTISYMYRNTKMYDTLLQMGRWFGFRPGFEDLCRVWLSEESIDWYSHIAEATEELRQQVKQMRRDELSPRDFGLFVRAHPETLTVTALNKMQNAENRTIKVNFSNKNVEMGIIPADTNIHDQNRDRIENFYKLISTHENVEQIDTGKGEGVFGVSVREIGDFLAEFRVHKDQADRKNLALKYLREISDVHPIGDVIFVSPEKRVTKKEGVFQADQSRAVAKSKGEIKTPILEPGWLVNKARVASRGDEKLGLSDSLIAEVIKENVKPSDTHYRAKRNRPLLMLHSLTLENGDNVLAKNVPTFNLSFPGGNYTSGVDFVVNKVWLEQFETDRFDDPDEEEDYDTDF